MYPSYASRASLHASRSQQMPAMVGMASVGMLRTGAPARPGPDDSDWWGDPGRVTCSTEVGSGRVDYGGLCYRCVMVCTSEEGKYNDSNQYCSNDR
jgi:hypothetical protein